MSNKLHTFDDNDCDGRRPVVNSLLNIRQSWKKVQEDIIYVERHGMLPISQKVEKETPIGSSTAELKVQLQLLYPNISKLKKKIEEMPDSKKVDGWKADYNRLMAIKLDTINKIKKIENERA